MGSDPKAVCKIDCFSRFHLVEMMLSNEGWDDTDTPDDAITDTTNDAVIEDVNVTTPWKIAVGYRMKISL